MITFILDNEAFLVGTVVLILLSLFGWIIWDEIKARKGKK